MTIKTMNDLDSFTEREEELLNKYTSIHKHSTFKKDGVATIKEHVQYAVANEVKDIFLTDHGDMGGILDFYYQCEAAKIKPNLGCEFYYVLNVNEKFTILEEKDKYGNILSAKKKTLRPYHLILIAKNYKGYQTIVRLNNEAQKNFYGKPRIDYEILKRIMSDAQGTVICSTACMKSPLYEHPDHAFELHSIFKDDFYLELQYHGYNPEKEKAYIDQLISYHKKYGMKIIITNDVHINKEEDIILHRLFTASDRGLHIESEEAAYMQGKGYHNLKGKELYSIVKDVIPRDIFFEALKSVEEVCSKCEVILPFAKGHFVFPDFKIPEGFANNFEYLSHLCYTSKRYKPVIHETQLKKELKVFKDCGFVDYILPLQDVIDFCGSEDIAVGPGRGSAAGSLINYLIRLTQLDPTKYGLSFDRFITAKYDSERDVYVNARQSAPDVDIDFEDPARVFNYVRHKYGKDRVCGIGTHMIYKAKSALKEVLRVYKIEPQLANYYSKFIGDDIISFSQYLKVDDNGATVLNLDEYEGKRTECALPRELDPIIKYIPLILKLEGRIGNASRHAAGVVFSDHLQDNIPVFIDKHSLKKGSSSDYVKNENVESAVDGENLFIDCDDEVEYVSQYNMDSIKNTGFTKYDFLGLSTLKVLKICQKLTGIKWDELDPTATQYKEVYEAIFAKGKTAGIFQFSSNGMRNLLKTMEANCFGDCQASNALFRPQTLKQELDKVYINNKQNGYDKVHPIVDAIFEETYGVPVYQEQVLNILTQLGKIESFDADTFRKILADNKTNTNPEQLAKLMNYKDAFIKGAVENSMSKEDAEALYSDLASKSGYSFNKAHSCCYAYIAFCLAYYKFYHPFEFVVAVLADTPEELLDVLDDISSFSKQKIEIRYPNLNLSKMHPTVEIDSESGEKFIQLGLSHIYGLGAAIAEEIIEKAPYDYSTLKNIHTFLKNNEAAKVWDVNWKQWKVATQSKGGAKIKKEYCEQFGYPPVVDREAQIGALSVCDTRKLTSKSLQMLMECGALYYADPTCEAYIPTIASQIKHFNLILKSNDKKLDINLKKFYNASNGKGKVISGFIIAITDKLTKNMKPYKDVLLYNPILMRSFKVKVWENSFQDNKGRDAKQNKGFVAQEFLVGDAVAFRVNVSTTDTSFITYESGQYLDMLS